MNKVLSVCLGILLLFTPYYVYAAEHEIVYKDGEFAVDVKDVLEDNIIWMPGDKIRQDYVVKNESKDTVRMYLKVSTMTELSTEMQEWVQVTVCSKESGLLHVFQLANSDNGSINKSIEIGAFAPGQINELTVEITLSEEADNRCKDMVTELGYEFEAEEIEDSQRGAPETGDNDWDFYLGLFVIGGLLLECGTCFTAKGKYDL